MPHKSKLTGHIENHGLRVMKEILVVLKKQGTPLENDKIDWEVAINLGLPIKNNKIEATPEDLKRFKKDCYNARTFLNDARIIEKFGATRGTWVLTLKGNKEEFSLSELDEIRKTYRKPNTKSSKVKTKKNIQTNESSQSLYNEPINLILYGPPGTGKTHETKLEALKPIIGEEETKELNGIENRPKLEAEFKKHSEAGRVEFVTFHQSFSYQEFVEGLRPVTQNENSGESKSGFSLKPHDGIFKKICTRALKNSRYSNLDRSRSIYQVAVNHSRNTDNYIKKCLDKSIVCIGLSNNVNWTEMMRKGKEEFENDWNDNVDEEEINNTGGRTQTYNFRFNTYIGDYVVLADGKEKFVAIGVINGPYGYDENEQELPHFRNVEWLWVDIAGKNHTEIYPHRFTNHAFYPLSSTEVDWDKLEQLIPEQDLSAKILGLIPGEPTRNVNYQFEGKLLKPLVDKNPRHETAEGRRSLQIILDYDEKGILYEDFIDEGGGRNHLNWDFEHGHVSVDDVTYSEILNIFPRNYVLIIDEINRANISKVFGELITLLEVDKRIGADHELKVRLPYSGDLFGVPQNLHIIGTMNTADRSIALLDTALRRRFKFRELMPNPNIPKFTEIRIGETGNLSMLLQKINERITYLYDREHQIGHAYFMRCVSDADVENVIRDEIIPLLAEYFFEDRSKVAKVLEDKVERKDGKLIGCFFEAERLAPKFINEGELEEEVESKWLWEVREPFEFEKLDFS